MGLNRRVVAVIPARWGSRRFPGKPLALILGAPMIAHVVRRVLRARRVDAVWVATDDKRIARAAEVAGARAVLTSRRCRSGTDRVAEAVRRERPPIVLNVQGDEPALDPAAVDAVADLLLRDAKLPMATVVAPLRDVRKLRDPNVVKAVLAENGDALYFSRAPIPHVRDGGQPRAYQHLGLYGYRYGCLMRLAALPPAPLERAERLEQLRALENGISVRAAVMRRAGPAVDVPGDVQKVERYLMKTR